MRVMTQQVSEYVSFHTDAQLRFLKFRLHYILFLLFFAVYAISPLKVCSDRTLKGLLQDSETASIKIVMIEKVLNYITDRLSLDELMNYDDGDVEVMVKKKRALLRAITLLFILLIATAAHIASRFRPEDNFIVVCEHFLPARCPETIRISEVYLSPHSGLSPPYLLS